MTAEVAPGRRKMRTMRWPWRSRQPNARVGRAPADRGGGSAGPVLSSPAPAVVSGFVCSTCGRTDLPAAGGWDPPICLECDAAINEDAIRGFEADLGKQ